MTNQERFIPTLQKIEEKIHTNQPLNEHEKAYLSAVISNQINVQHGYANLITYDDDVVIYEFTEEITYQKETA